MELGVTEKIVAEQMVTVVKDSQRILRELVEVFGKLEGVNWEEAIQDTEKKNTIAQTLEPLRKLQANLQMSTLIPIVLEIIVNKEAKPEA